MRKFIDKQTGKTVSVSHYSSGNSGRIDLSLYTTDGEAYTATLQDFLSERFMEVAE